MTAKPFQSERVTARPPLPSIAPPTDDIDAEWGADEIPAAAKLPQLSAAPSVPAPAPSASAPAAAPSAPPVAPSAPPVAPSAPPAARSSSSPPRPASSSPPRADNPLRKQTLLGIAPVIPARSEPPRAASDASSPPLADNPLRKQTLFGIAPVVPARAPEPAREAAREPARAEVPASDTPLARDATPKARAAEPRLATTDDDLDDAPALRAKGARWFVPAAAAALLALGFVALQRLDRAPVPAPAAATPIAPAAQAPPAAQPEAPVAETPAEAAHATPEASAAEAAQAPAAEPILAPGQPATNAEPEPGANGQTLSRVNVTSEPPGARLFWKGHEVGTTPFVLEIPAGQRRSFELGLPGFVTRKVVIDGSKPDLSIGMQPQRAAPIGASSRK